MLPIIVPSLTYPGTSRSQTINCLYYSNKIPSIFQNAYVPHKSIETAHNPLKQHLLHWNSTYPDLIKLTIQTQQHPRHNPHSTCYVFGLRHSTIISFCIDCPPSELMARLFDRLNLILQTDYHLLVSQNIYHLIVKSPMVSLRALY